MEKLGVVLKSIETAEDFKVELRSEGPLFRVNVNDDGGYQKTRIFTDLHDANALFDAYLTGN